jgi:serpin B
LKHAQLNQELSVNHRSRWLTILVLEMGMMMGPEHVETRADATEPAKAAETGSQPTPVEKVVSGNTQFALDLYAREASPQPQANLFLSPFSLSTALAMTLAGARGETATEMEQVLHLDLPPGQLHPAFHVLTERLRSRVSPARAPEDQPASSAPAGNELLTANALWSQSGEPVVADFQALIQANYQGSLFPIDFRQDTLHALQTINQWVADQTRGKIKDLLRPDHVPPTTRLILTNAIYFKGLWATPFDPKATAPAPFQVSAEESVSAPFLNQTNTFDYIATNNAQVLELPYQGDALAMAIILPRKADGLAELEASLSAKALQTTLAGLKPQKVKVSIPKFMLSATADLAKVLESLGMSRAFRPDQADFSGITGDREFVISAVVHKAFVEVEERGTEAAAATAVVGVRSSAMPRPIPTFRADHPFLFLIRDRESGAILFIGRLARP